MKFIILASLLMSQFASAYEVGEKVLFKSGYRTHLGTIINISPAGKKFKLDFHDTLLNFSLHSYASVDEIKPYQPARAFIQSGGWFDENKIFAVGDFAMLEFGYELYKGKIVDVTSDGMIKMDFGSYSNNLLMGKSYHNTDEKVLRFKKASAVEGHKIGDEAMYANENGKIAELTTDGYVRIDFDTEHARHHFGETFHRIEELE